MAISGTTAAECAESVRGQAAAAAGHSQPHRWPVFDQVVSGKSQRQLLQAGVRSAGVEV
jgi:hypothetical protein